MFAKTISDAFVEGYKNKPVPWGPLGYVVYKRTYSRRLDEGTEEWWQTLKRCCNGLLEIGAAYSQDEIQHLYDLMFNLKGSIAGRFLWQLGTDTVRKVGADSLLNCWGVCIDEPIEPFCFTFNELMLGGGVGFSILPQDVFNLPPVKFAPVIKRVEQTASTPYDVDHIVTDNREGWVRLLRMVLKSYFFTGQNIMYSTACVRDRGALIRGFGGTASGPEDLVKGIGQICEIISKRYGQKLQPIDCLDIQNILGQIVVAGNVRRSAELSVGDSRDHDYLYAKNWKIQQIPAWRSKSNNSVSADTFASVPEEFWNGYNGDGEPYGLINFSNHRKYGRLADGPGYRPDPFIKAVNPCSEISLENYECCNLSDIFLPNIKDEKELREVAKLLYMAQKAVTCMHYSHPRTQEVVDRNHRIGVGLTGYLQSQFYQDASALSNTYKSLEEYDRYYSQVLECNPSIKLTTIKPSGTLSKLPGVTAGAHGAYAPYQWRRIRFASDDKIAEACRCAGYHCEPEMRLDGTLNYDTTVVKFPVKWPEETVFSSEQTAIEQLENVKFLQTYWADNSVSVTVSYKPEELAEIKAWLAENYDDSIKAVSFLLHAGHGFIQAPEEPISSEEYYKAIEIIKPIDLKGIGESALNDNLECATGLCPVR